MDFTTALCLRRYIQFDLYIFIVWAFCNGVGIIQEPLVLLVPKPLMGTVYCVMLIAESIRMYFTHHQGFIRDFPKLVGFTLVTLLIQLPLVSSFLIVSILSTTPMDVVLNIAFLLTTCFEAAWCIRAVREGYHCIGRPYEIR